MNKITIEVAPAELLMAFGIAQTVLEEAKKLCDAPLSIHFAIKALKEADKALRTAIELRPQGFEGIAEEMENIDSQLDPY